MNTEDCFSACRLADAFAEVRRKSACPGIDGVSPDSFAVDLDLQLADLSNALISGDYQPSALLRMAIPKPSGGSRQLGIATVRDRIVLYRLRHILSRPIESALTGAAFAYRPGRSAQAAVARVAGQLRSGKEWVLLTDIQDFFDRVPIRAVSSALAQLSIEPQILSIAERLLWAHALSDEKGLAQGSPLSPLLSNLVLTPIDRTLDLPARPLVRYCDNLCFLCTSEAAAQQSLVELRAALAPLGLRLKSRATSIVSAQAGFSWLGFWIDACSVQVSQGAIKSLRSRVEHAAEDCLPEDLPLRLQPIVSGWASYFSAPLPAQADLGTHAPLIRKLLGSAQGEQQPDDRTDPERPQPDSEDDAEYPERTDETEDALIAESSRTESSRLLALADKLASSGDYSQAESVYEEAQALASAAPVSAALPPPVVTPPLQPEVLDAYLGLFSACQEHFEVAPPRLGPTGRREFTKVEGPPSPRDLREHLDGQKVLAVRPRLANSSTLLGVIDIDAAEPKDRTAAQAYAEALSTVARSWELHALLEDTGGRGFHLWVPLRERVSSDAMHTCLSALCRTAGSPAAGVTIELLPGPAHAPETHAQVIALPLGVHPVTQQRSRMHWLSGREVAPDLLALLDAPLNPPHQLLGRDILARPADTPTRSEPTPQSSSQPSSPPASEVSTALPDWLTFGEEVHKLMTGCGLLLHLAQKARAVGHLTHAERLSVLYSLGHLGESGEQAIHALISQCRNYDPKETARQIGKLGGIPIGCTRLREKHALTDELRAQCVCSFSVQRLRGGYPTPLLHIGRFRRTWLEVLRGRKAARSGTPGLRVPAVAEEVPSASTPAEVQSLDEPTADGLRLQTIPPHEWA